MHPATGKTSKRINIIETTLVLILISLIVFVMINVSRIQGTARVVNYAGIVRGATQRLVKLEISGDANQELMDSLDEILAGLKDGSEELKLVRLEDTAYQTKLTALTKYWIDLKDEILLVRKQGADGTEIIRMSEEYFQLADETVSAAEVYSQKKASELKTVEILLSAVMLGMVFLMISEALRALQLAKMNRSLNQKAYIDLHTGLPNKSRCEEFLTDRVFLTEPTCCIMFDMNGLKAVNDTLGHVVGDTLIKNFANMIRNAVPEKYFVGRYGGDEFVAIIKDTTEEEVKGIIADVEQSVKDYNEYRHDNQEAGISLSFASGYSMSTAYPECTMQVILDKADQNMYRNKKRMLEKSLEARMESIQRRNPEEKEEFLTLLVSNLSKNRLIRYDGSHNLEIPLETGKSYEEQTALYREYVVPGTECDLFEKLHQREYLLTNFSEGASILTVEFQLRTRKGKVRWIRNMLNLVTDPRSKDVLLYEYSYDISREKNLEMMMQFAVMDDYDLIGCVNLEDSDTCIFFGKNSFHGAEIDYLETEYEKVFLEFAQDALPREEQENYLTRCSLEHVRQQLKDSESFELVFHMKKNGSLFTKKVQYTRYGKDEKLCMFTQVDITGLMAEEQKKQEVLENALRQAREAGKAKTDFLSRMSHDIRTPMNTIIGMSALARDEIHNPKAIEDYLHKIDTAGEFLLSLVNDCLDLEKIESNKMVLKKERYAYRDFINAIRTMFLPLCEAKNIELRIEERSVASELDILTDPVRFEQIFFNVLSNAVKYTPEGGIITFRTKNKTVHENIVSCDFVVRDSGIGMSEDFQKLMFEPFEQESRKVVTKSQGSGLGLAIVKSIVDMMGGTIRIQSREGEGTTVTIHLDLEMTEPLPEQKKENSQQLSVDVLVGKRILLIEDHPLNTEIAKKFLNKAGMTVVCANNGKEGVMIFAASLRRYFDAVLMDIRMPVMNGLEAAAAIRAMPREDAKTIPIIAMSANAYQEDVQKSLEAGMNAHLTKPMEPKKLYAALAKYILEKERS